MKPIGILILNWNGAALLRRYLPSVVECNSNDIADIVVVDNGSTDESRKVLEEEFPSVKTLYFDTNYGFAEGYNRAVKQLGYRYSVLLNSDVATSPDWVRPLYDYLESHPEVAACQPKIISDTRRSHFEYAGASGGFLDKHGYPFCRGRIFDTVEEDHGQYDDVVDIFWATGAALTIRTDDYIAAGGLDKDFFAHMEEIDLCWRLHQCGRAIKVVPQSVVYHLGGGSLPTHGKPTSTSATTCFFSTRTSRRRKAGACSSSAASTTPSPSSCSSPKVTSPMPAPCYAPTPTTASRKAATTTCAPTPTCLSRSPTATATSSWTTSCATCAASAT